MELRETSVKWGNGYRRYYFVDGVRVSERYANALLKNHHHEHTRTDGLKTAKVVIIWNIGPHLSEPAGDQMEDCDA